MVSSTEAKVETQVNCEDLQEQFSSLTNNGTN